MNPLDHYSFKETIGEGGFAEVILAIHRETGTAVAIKIIPARDSDDPDHQAMVEREIDILCSVEHPCIYKLFDFVRTEDKYYLIFEYLDNGKLLDFVNNNGRLTERTARQFFTQLVSALQHLYTRNIAHRDIKAENVLLDRYFNVRLIDFGLSNFFNREFPLMRTICGCQAYAPPEMLKGQPYTPSTDVWSSGVLLFAVCAGYLPFSDPSIPRLIEKVINDDPKYPNFFSHELCDLLSRMMSKDPFKRIALDDILAHPWVTAGALPTTFGDLTNEAELDSEIVEQFANYGLNPAKIETTIRISTNQSAETGNRSNMSSIKKVSKFRDRPNNETVSYRILKRMNDTEKLARHYQSPSAHLPNDFSVLTHNASPRTVVGPLLLQVAAGNNNESTTTTNNNNNNNNNNNSNNNTQAHGYPVAARRILFRSRSRATAMQRKQASKSVFAKGSLNLGYV